MDWKEIGTRIKRPDMLATKLAVLVNFGLLKDRFGNYTFQIKCDEIPITGAAYKKDDGWKYVWNLPDSSCGPDHLFPRASAAIDAMVEEIAAVIQKKIRQTA